MNNLFNSQERIDEYKCLLENKLVKRIYDIAGELLYNNTINLINRSCLFMTNICTYKNILMKNPLLRGSKCYSIILSKDITGTRWSNRNKIPFSILRTEELDVTGDMVSIPDLEEMREYPYKNNDKKYSIERVLVIDPPEEIWDQITTKEYKETGLVPVLYKGDDESMMENFFDSEENDDIDFYKCLLENRVIKRIYETTGCLNYNRYSEFNHDCAFVIKREALFIADIYNDSNVLMKNPLLRGSKCYSIVLSVDITETDRIDIPFSILRTEELDVIGDMVFIAGSEDINCKYWCDITKRLYNRTRFIVIDPPEEIWEQITTKEYKETGLVPVLYKTIEERHSILKEENEFLKKKLEDLETKFDLLYSMVNKNE